MGYNSTFTLAVSVTNVPLIKGVTGLVVDDRAVIADFRRQNVSASNALREDGSACEQVKWYEAQPELAAFSGQYPALLFQLDWIGEDGERGRIYAHNGKSYEIRPEMLYPPFDSRQLT